MPYSDELKTSAYLRTKSYSNDPIKIVFKDNFGHLGAERARHCADENKKKGYGKSGKERDRSIVSTRVRIYHSLSEPFLK